VAIAAFVVSLFALIVSSTAVLFTKRQSDAAIRTVALDAERRHQERTPTFDGGIELVNDGKWHRLWLRLTSPEALSSVEVEINEGSGVAFTTGQHGVNPTEPAPVLHIYTADEHGATGLAPDERTAWRVQLSASRSPKVRLMVRSVIGDDLWTVPIPVDVPLDPSVW